MKNTVSINVPILARVEGEGALELDIREQKIESLRLCIYEPPRLFEKFLEGRHFDEVLDIVARICGICPVAYQMSATNAIENCFGITVTPSIEKMRRLFYCGEWMESHSMHIHFLAAPDFLGYSSALEMAKDFPNEVQRGLRLQQLGNSIIKMFGGRSVHPVGACVGGFYHAPTLVETKNLLTQLKNIAEDAAQLIHWTASLSLPDNTHDFICVSLQDADEYPMAKGHIVSDTGLNISIENFDQFFKEYQAPYSTALHCRLQDKPYLVGPLARLNINFDHLPTVIKNILHAHHINIPSKNMYHSIVARAVEIYYCVLEAIDILENYTYPEISRVPIKPKTGAGFGCTEAPRGMLWHAYTFDENGCVKQARIVPPTSQNQARIEEDLRISLEQYGLEKNEADLRAYSEMIIRNYDPCISCSTHFLDLRTKRL